MATNPLLQLKEQEQSPWLDNLDREMLTSGRLARLIAEDGISGIDLEPRHLQQGHDPG